ncbi:MAG: ABC transporter ATP-binding protein [Parcubacteria group bacterium]|nr:ABC transporter ATP-binding protein [Parcubacteria group bacterium]
MSSHILRLENIVIRYPDNQTKRMKTILNNLTLRVRKGEFVTIVGPTGCGKSTMLRLILGSEKPTNGVVIINGNSAVGSDRNRGIVFQKYSLFEWKTVLENVMFGLELEAFSLPARFYNPIGCWKKRKRFKEEAMEYLESVRLAEHWNKYPYQLSGGQRQRTAIAQALIMKPSILMMDEPFGALDESTREHMQIFMLEQWEKQGTTIFFITHSTEEALFLGTRIIVLSPYWVTDDGKNSEGSKIVIDKKVAVENPKIDDKYTEEFNHLLAQIRSDGIEKRNPQPLSKFDLSHPDAIPTGPAHSQKETL